MWGRYPKSLIGKHDSNERVAVLEERHRNLRLKDLGATEISDRDQKQAKAMLKASAPGRSTERRENYRASARRSRMPIRRDCHCGWRSPGDQKERRLSSRRRFHFGGFDGYMIGVPEFCRALDSRSSNSAWRCSVATVGSVPAVRSVFSIK